MLAAFLAALVFFHSSEFLLALWSTGKPDLRSFLSPPSATPAIVVAQEELPFTTLQCPSPSPSVPLVSSFPHAAFLFSRKHLLVPAALTEYSLEATFFPSLCAVCSVHAAFLFSREYLLAMAAALTEYALETALFPAFKRRLWPVAWVGGALLLAGEAVRKAAMVTAGRSFTHDIQTEKRREHRLVTHGLYRWVRLGGGVCMVFLYRWQLLLQVAVAGTGGSWMGATAVKKFGGVFMGMWAQPSPDFTWKAACPCGQVAQGRWVRHPCNTAWFAWSIATQLLDVTTPSLPSPHAHVPNCYVHVPHMPHAHSRWVSHPRYTGCFVWSIATELLPMLHGVVRVEHDVSGVVQSSHALPMSPTCPWQVGVASGLHGVVHVEHSHAAAASQPPLHARLRPRLLALLRRPHPLRVLPAPAHRSQVPAMRCPPAFVRLIALSSPVPPPCSYEEFYLHQFLDSSTHSLGAI
ncbi:unnamed protein product, partial [Closterium sp. NIES-64]